MRAIFGDLCFAIAGAYCAWLLYVAGHPVWSGLLALLCGLLMAVEPDKRF